MVRNRYSRINIYLIIFAGLIMSCNQTTNELPIQEDHKGPYVVVLGIAQDAGFPQAGCLKSCCSAAWENPKKRKMVSCIGIVDPHSNTCWMIDATPDFKYQLQLLQHQDEKDYSFGGVFLTHAHIGHYTGLIHLGREVMGSNRIPVYAMPVMADYLTGNGPWSQLVSLENIQLVGLQADTTVSLTDRISIIPLKVPHRDEFSETVGYSISGQNGRLLFIPDINKWSLWDRDLKEEIRVHDFALIDGSFYANGEIPNRDMSEIPHPFITETMQLLEKETNKLKSKVHFIHLNHTNPILDPLSPERQEVIHKGYQICDEGQRFLL